MNATTLEATTTAPVTRRQADPAARRSRTPVAPVPGRTRRRPGRGTGPTARPARPAGAPVALVQQGRRPQSCQVDAPQLRPAAASSTWRLTDRAIALVLVTGLLIVTAALAVVGLTALRVTGEDYHVVGQTVLTGS